MSLSKAGTQNACAETLLKTLARFEPALGGYFSVMQPAGALRLTQKAQRLLGLKRALFADCESLIASLSKERRRSLELFFRKNLFQATEIDLTFSVKQEGKLPQWLRFYSSAPLLKEKSNCRLVLVQDISKAQYSKMIVQSTLDGTFLGDIKNNTGLFSGPIFDSMQMDAGFYPHNAMEYYNSNVYAGDKVFHRIHNEHMAKSRSPINRAEYRVYDKNYQPFWISNRNRLFFNERDEPTLIVGGFINVSALRHYNQHVEQTFETCHVTGLPNRFRLYKDIPLYFAKGKGYGYFIFVNIDNFSRINQLHGYRLGNVFLKEYGQLLQSNRLYGGTIYRNNSDYFVLVMPEATPAQALEQLKCFQSFSERPLTIDGALYPFGTTSAAVAYKGEPITPEVAVHRGRIAIEALRKSGGEKYKVVKNNIFKEYDKRSALEKQLRQSVLQGMKDFFLVYQPIISAKQGHCVGVEALLRWRDPQGHVVSPTVFVPVLEESGLMELAGEWVFKEASRQCREWLSFGFHPDFYVSINATTSQLSNKHFAALLLRHLEEIGLPPVNVVIEITESALMRDFQHGMKQLNKLKKSGVRLAIDDFGTGYSSLNYLRVLPVDNVKIDQSFVKNLEDGSYSKEFIASIIRITQRTGRTACIEGVEQAAQAELLEMMDADFFQGYLFAKPQKPGELASLFSSGKLFFAPTDKS